MGGVRSGEDGERLFAVHLDKLGREHGVRAFALHPGGILTPLQRHLAKEEMIERGWIDETGALVDPTPSKHRSRVRPPRCGPPPPPARGPRRVYCEDCEIAEPAVPDGSRTGVKDWATDPEQAARLWDLSAELTGVDAFASRS